MRREVANNVGGRDRRQFALLTGRAYLNSDARRVLVKCWLGAGL